MAAHIQKQSDSKTFSPTSTSSKTNSIPSESLKAEESEPLQIMQDSELPPGYSRNPLQMKKPINNPFAPKPFGQNPLQLKTNTQNPLQLKINMQNPLRPIKYDNPFQRKTASAEQQSTHQLKKENNTGLPDNFKAGIEALSGYSMDDVTVHYDRNKSAQLQASAYEQGSDAQEGYLPHKAWHVMQQKQGPVRPIMQMKQGIASNDDKHLETEADVMGGKALEPINQNKIEKNKVYETISTPLIQRVVHHTRSTDKEYPPNKYYSSYDEEQCKLDPTRKIQLFDDKAEAEKLDKLLSNEIVDKDKEETHKHNQEIRDRKRKENQEEIKGYNPPSSEKAILFHSDEKTFDPVKLTVLDSENVKQFIAIKFKERAGGTFETQVVKLGSRYYVLTNGSGDIKMETALVIPQLAIENEKSTPVKREGKALTYKALALGLDKIVKEISEALGENETLARKRLGTDLDRLTRGNAVKEHYTYTSKDLDNMTEIAMVLRLDKGRVPGATAYIRQAMTSGEHSFHDLFNGEYEGAGKGGVEHLRHKTTDDGIESEGSDIDDGKSEITKKVKTDNDSSLSQSSSAANEFISQGDTTELGSPLLSEEEPDNNDSTALKEVLTTEGEEKDE